LSPFGLDHLWMEIPPSVQENRTHFLRDFANSAFEFDKSRLATSEVLVLCKFYDFQLR